MAELSFLRGFQNWNVLEKLEYVFCLLFKEFYLLYEVTLLTAKRSV